jgi:hypothetical protein
MSWGVLLLTFLWSGSVPAQSLDASDLNEFCVELAKRTKLPVKLSTQGKVQRAKWDKVDEVLSRLDQGRQEKPCQLTFEQIFRTDREDLFLPITNTIVRVVPESTLIGVSVFDQEGVLLGEYQGRTTYSRKGNLYAVDSYVLYYFQFKDTEGELQSSGTQLLLDTFLMKWSEVRDRQAIGPRP